MTEFNLVLPCYNESNSLKSLVSRVMTSVVKRNLTPKQFQLVLVENGSKDNSLEVLRELKDGEHGPFLQIVQVPQNQGYGFGLLQGLNNCDSEIVAWSHADEQCDPEDAFLAWENIKTKGTNWLIKGKRHGRAFQEQLISKVFELIVSLILFRKITEINAQPKVFHKSLLPRLTNPPHDFAFDLYVLLKARENGLKFHEIDVNFGPRKHGHSNWSASFRSRMRTISKMLSYVFKYRWNKV